MRTMSDFLVLNTEIPMIRSTFQKKNPGKKVDNSLEDG